MHLDALVTWLFVGLVAGGLAGFLIRPGGYGWRADLLLGLGGSLVGTVIFHALVLTSLGAYLSVFLILLTVNVYLRKLQLRPSATFAHR